MNQDPQFAFGPGRYFVPIGIGTASTVARRAIRKYGIAKRRSSDHRLLSRRPSRP